MKRQHGFSLIELLAAAAIIGVLATVAVPVAETMQRRQKEKDLRIALRDIRGAIDAYKQAAQAGKVLMNPGESGYPPTLAALMNGVENQSDKTGPKLYFIRRIPRDPFADDRTVPAIKTWGLRSFDSGPDLPEEGADVFDVYSKSGRKGLNGIPYAEW
jgi:general secretion pathway protein G